ncbi:hypothetical protein V5O48_017165 [Marasmius crinis-equi]|uniref:Uncharacterized protein n=1 Tax=Marasmius crinis-equi TaxID=585013 RepID=A0ABR3EPP8_9AGAR
MKTAFATGQGSSTAATTSSPSSATANSATDSNSASNDSAAGSHKDTKAIIIGSVVGGVAAIVLLLLLLFLIFRRHRRATRRESAAGEDVFYKDKMVVERQDSVDGAGTGVGFAQKEKDIGREDLDPDSPTTPLREDFEDERSAASSLYSEESAAASRVGSGIDSGLPTIGTTPLASMFGSRGLVESSAPLTPSSGSPTHFRSPSRARTDRQMLIEQKILELQGQLITAKGSEQEKSRVRAMLRERIEKLEELRKSGWALSEGNGGGDVPEALRG